MPFTFQFVLMAKMRVSKSAEKLGNLILKNKCALGLNDNKTLNSEMACGINSKKWERVIAWGMAEEILAQPGYKTCGNFNVDVLKKLLGEKAISRFNDETLGETVLELALSRGLNLAEGTQFYTPSFNWPPIIQSCMKIPLLKYMTGILRFILFLLETTINTWTKQGKLIVIWRRGFASETKVADAITKLNTLEKAARSTRNITNQEAINNIISRIQNDRKILWDQINQIEPRRFTL